MAHPTVQLDLILPYMYPELQYTCIAELRLGFDGLDGPAFLYYIFSCY